MNLDPKIEYLKMIQQIITRMANYGLFLKAWGITLTTAILAFAAEAKQPELMLIGILPITVFWVLDATFLGYERQYRELHNNVAKYTNEAIDFNLNPPHAGEKLRMLMMRPVPRYYWGAQLGVLLLAVVMMSCLG